MAKAGLAGKKYCPLQWRPLAFLSMMSRGVALLVGSFIACCGRQGGTRPAQPDPSTTLSGGADAGTVSPPLVTVVHIEDDGKSFDLGRGDIVVFELARSAGTGYAWAPAQVDPLALAQEGDRSNEISSALPGAQKMDVYRFRALKATTSTVEMSLRRPFGSAPPVRTIRITIHVR
jgi:predicted secreted protein